MCRRDLTLLVAGAGLGAWVVPIVSYLTARAAGRHFLSIVTKENPR